MQALTLTHRAAPLVTYQGRPPLETIIEQFLYDQDVRERSRTAYRRALKQFFLWVQDAGLDPWQLQRNHIIAYKHHQLERGLAPATVAAYITALRQFYEFMDVVGYYKNIAARIKPPDVDKASSKQFMTLDQAQRLLNHLRDTDPRAYAMAAVMIYGGLRVVEVSRLKLSDITEAHGVPVLMVHGKGRYETQKRQVEYVADLQTVLKQYIATHRRGALAGEPVFVSNANRNRGKGMTATMISMEIKKGLRAIGINTPTITAHSLRHTNATLAIERGVSLEDVARNLGHVSVNTTKRYTHAIEDRKSLQRQPMTALNGLFNLN